MSERHGVTSRAEARRLGLDHRRERRAVASGILQRSVGGVLLAAGAPDTWLQRAAIATCLPGATAACHGTAARLLGLDGFGRYTPIEVLITKGAWPKTPPGTTAFFTRVDPSPDIVVIDAIPTLSLAAMLCLMAARFDRRTISNALDAALAHGLDPEEIYQVAWRWRQRGRRGPQVILAALTHRCGNLAR
jgi:hypothetical protein